MSLQLTVAVSENCWHFRLYHLLYLKLRTSDKLEISAVIKLNPYSCWKTLLRVYSYRLSKVAVTFGLWLDLSSFKNPYKHWYHQILVFTTTCFTCLYFKSM